MRLSIVVTCLFASLLPCLVLAQTATINYTAHNLSIPNPERGFYHFSETFSNAYDPLVVSEMSGLRNGYTPGGGNYTVPVTLMYRTFYLNGFVNAPISSTYLDLMQDDFDAARTAGVKIVVRFAYTQDFTPPYGDATKSRVLSHISQLTPLLTTNQDVIATVQAGFIGTWGEWCATDHFGDVCSSPWTLNTTNWNDRNEVVNALLAAVPTTRTIQLRTPRYKQKAVYGPNAAVTVAAVGGRIGIHNDCFLATYNDSGTYNDHDLGNDDTLHLKPYLASEANLGVPVGGETCETNSPWHLCQSMGGKADVEMKRFHYSFINADYNNAVNNSWSPCIGTIERKLGYRFELSSGTYSTTGSPGGSVSLSFTINNTGYAKPYNPRAVQFVLRNVSTQQLYYAPINTDPQTWPLNTPTTITQSFCLPSNMPAGSYDLLLSLPDPLPSLSDRSEYAIQLANTGVWEAATGFNKLNHTIVISGSSSCSGLTVFSPVMALPVEMLRFTGQQTKAGILLQWETGMESNTAQYRIERSVDGVQFETIGQETPRGPHSAYDFTDRDYPFSDLYYRIQTVDNDGAVTYSKSIHIAPDWAFHLAIRPNPATDMIRFETPDHAAVPYRLYAASGVLVQTGLTDGTVNTGDLAKGVYYLEVMTESGVLLGRFVR